MMSEDWHGEERRGIPVQLITYMDARLEAHTSTIKTLFEDHTVDERDQYDQLINKINANDHKSEARHDETQSKLSALQQSVTAYMTKMEDHFNHAPPCSPLTMTIPDADWKGHHDYHKNEMDWAGKMKDLKWTLIKVIMGTGAVGLLGWVGVLMWLGFLRGPNV